MVIQSPATFTAVIPAYNPGTMLREALESVAAQTLRPDWVVVVDDGSSDGTFSAAQRWLAEFGIAGEAVRQDNQGISAARNAGIARRRSNTIALLDADDLWLPQHLARLRRAYDLCPDAVVAFGDSRFFGDARSRKDLLAEKFTLPLVEEQLAPQVYRLSAKVFDSSLSGLFFPVSASSFRVDRGDPEPRFHTDLTIGEDRFLYLQLARRGPFVYSHEQSARTRRHHSNTTHSDKEIWLRENALLVLEKIRLDADLALSPAEVAIVRAAEKRAADSLLFAASEAGIATYLHGLRTVGRFVPLTSVWSLRDAARSVRSSIVRPGARSGPAPAVAPGEARD